VDLEARKQVLEKAGLVVLDEAWVGPVPEPMTAWRPIISGAAIPTATVRILKEGRHLPEVQAKWEEIAEESGLFGDHGEFLMSVGGMAAAPWARVRRTLHMHLAHRLGPKEGPEFAAMAMAGSVVCGVTTEEYDVWILATVLS